MTIGDKYVLVPQKRKWFKKVPDPTRERLYLRIEFDQFQTKNSSIAVMDKHGKLLHFYNGDLHTEDEIFNLYGNDYQIIKNNWKQPGAILKQDYDSDIVEVVEGGD